VQRFVRQPATVAFNLNRSFVGRGQTGRNWHETGLAASDRRDVLSGRTTHLAATDAGHPGSNLYAGSLAPWRWPTSPPTVDTQCHKFHPRRVGRSGENLYRTRFLALSRR
jgi:hypothetical protein